LTDQSAQRTEHLKKEVNSLEIKLARSESLLSQAQRDISNSKENNASVESQSSAMQADIARHMDANDYLNSQLREIQAQLQNADAKNQELEQTIQSLRGELKSKQDEQSNQAKIEQDIEDIERNNNTKALRKIKDLLRQKYKLDVEIWRDRKSLPHNRPKVLKKMAQADLILQDIITAVSLWDNSTDLYSPEEWEIAEVIRRRIFKEGKKVWANRPPWINAHGVEEDEPIFVRARRR